MGKSTRTWPFARIDSGTNSVSHDQRFELLSNHRRRYALHHLYRIDHSVDLGQLAELVAAWENDVSVAQVSPTERKRVYTSLQQVHLPKMDEMDVVEFDQSESTVRLGPAAAELDVYMEVVGGGDVPWSQFYLVLSVVNVAFLLAVAADLYPFAVLPDLAWGFFAATTVLVAASVHTYVNHTEMYLGTNERPTELEE